jgi:hypothetical protein
MNIRLAGFFLIVVVLGFSACKKNNDAPATVVLADSLNVINASADTLNIYLNGTRLSNNSNLYPAGSSGYYYVPSGLQTYQIKQIFNPVTSVVRTLFSYPLTLTAHHYYSLFIPGETSDLASNTIDTLQSDTTAGTCYVRFVNASPDAGSLDFSAGGVSFSNQSFKSATGFKLVDTSSLSPILLYHSGSSTPVISGHYPLVEGKSYTFYSKGKLSGTGNAVFSIGVTVNYN